MSLLDLLVVLFVLSAGFGGYRAGFVSRASGWAGLLLGVTAALLIVPVVVRLLESADDAWILLAALVVLVAAAAFGQIVGLQVGERLRLSMPTGVGSVDRTAGAVAGGLGVLVVFWLLLPTLAAVPGWTSGQVADSMLASTMEDRLPEPPDTLGALRDAVGEDAFPAVFDEAPELEDPGPPPVELPLGELVQDVVTESVVRVGGTSCGRWQQGSGYVSSDGLVITNAHVVAGAGTVTVTDNAGMGHTGTVVAFDAERDLAALHVPSLDRRPLVAASSAAGDLGAAFGFPGGGELRVAPARVGDILRARGRDLFDQTDTIREVLVLAVNLRLGDSGAPIVNTSGAVIGVAFAVAPDGEDTAYAVTIGEVNAFLAEHGTGAPIGPSDCL